jgi:prolipoprotein diacylglyceryltransferase
LATKFHDVPGFHYPAQLFDSVMNLAAMGFLLLIERKKLLPGRMAALMLILHGSARFIYEFWRAGTEDQVAHGLATSTYWGSLPITQGHAMALALILIGGVWYFLAGRKKTVSTPESPEMHAA